MAAAEASPAWVVEARRHIGQAEIPGRAENGWIVSLWRAIKRGGIKSEDVPWCAAFVGACLEAVGIVSTRFESAASYATWGRALPHPVDGCIVVFSRKGGGHVGFCVGTNMAGDLLILGGNQSDAVNIRAFPRDRVTAYRWPAGVPLPPALPGLTLAEAARSTSEA
jgi:uncharacterized protein (TIGR02594 family)